MSGSHSSQLNSDVFTTQFSVLHLEMYSQSLYAT